MKNAQPGARGASVAARALAVLIAVAALPGCTRYYVFAHEPPKDGYQVETLRRPLQAAVTIPSNSDAPYVRAALQDSGWFSTLDAPRARADVAIDFLGVSCGEERHMADTFTGTWLGTLKVWAFDVPTLGMVPTLPEATTDCAVNFRYEVLKPTPTGARTTDYGYKRLRYAVTFTAKMYTSPEKQAYQTKMLFDTSVAKMLVEMAPAVASLQAGL